MVEDEDKEMGKGQHLYLPLSTLAIHSLMTVASRSCLGKDRSLNKGEEVKTGERGRGHKEIEGRMEMQTLRGAKDKGRSPDFDCRTIMPAEKSEGKRKMQRSPNVSGEEEGIKERGASCLVWVKWNQS